MGSQSVMRDAPLKPWYRQFWPWLLILLPTTSVVASMITIWLASRAPDTVVVDDYYKRGLAINQDLARDRAAARLGVEASVTFRGPEGLVEVQLNNGTRPPPRQLTLYFMHPTLSDHDARVDLAPTPNGEFRGLMGEPVAGEYHVRLESTDQQWRLQKRVRLPRTSALTLIPNDR